MAGFFDNFLAGKQARMQEDAYAQDRQYQQQDRAMRQQQMQAQQAQQQEQQRGNIAQLVHKGAQAIANAPPEQRPAIYSMVRSEMARHPEAQEWIAHLPPQYDEAQVMPVVQQVMTATGLYAEPEKDSRPAEIQTLDYLSTHPELAQIDMRRRAALAQLGPQAAAMYRAPPQPSALQERITLARGMGADDQQIQDIVLDRSAALQRAEAQQEKQVSQFSKRLEDEGIPAMETQLRSIESALGQYLDNKGQLKPGADIPGFGRMGSLVPDLLASSEANDVRQRVQSVANVILKSRSGAAVTEQELRRFLIEAGAGKGMPEDQLVRGVQLMRKWFDAQRQNVQGGYSPEVVGEYLRNSPEAAAWVQAPPQQAPQQSAPATSPRVVRTQAEYDALPSGAVYQEDDGQTYRKP